MPIDTTIDFPQGDVDRLFTQMRRAEKELGRSLGQSVRFAGWAVAGALGARTKVAKKFRPYRKVSTRRGVGEYRVTSYRQGSANKFTVRAKSVKELKTMPQVKIGRAGLAKSAWYWGLKKIGGGRNIGLGGVTQAQNKTHKDLSTRNLILEATIRL